MAATSSNISTPDAIRVKRALISVFDKTGVIELAGKLTEYGVEIISTGGSAKIIGEAGVAVTDVSSLTGFPEIMDGRVKTLHPGIHGGLLGIRNNKSHVEAMRENNIVSIDLLITNLYPFEKMVQARADYADCVENIDIGGPAMIRAGAKNHACVAVIIDPTDYAGLLQEMKENDGATRLQFRRNLAARAYGLTACYDTAIANWFARELEIETPAYRTVGGKLAQTMRYGENPHQKAALYIHDDQTPGVVGARQLQGKSLSYNNINDSDAAFELISEFNPEKTCAVAIIKHANPCGIALGNSLVEAYEKALACDPVSAFGGIIALNRTIDADVAEKMIQMFTEVIIAPDASEEARKIIASKKNLRLLLSGGLADSSVAGTSVRTVRGGILVQSYDNKMVEDSTLKIATMRTPDENEMNDMLFAFHVAKHVKSNAIVFAKNGATVGIGAGQMSRIDSTRIAMRKARDAAQAAGLDQSLTHGSVLASDAFFPFADGVLTAIETGVTAIIQPGGSVRDNEVIAAADKAGIVMAFTGVRHFRH